jgi:hypothetical protein
LLFNAVVMTRTGVAAAIFTLALASTACTGGSETNAAEEPKPATAQAAAEQKRIDARRELNAISSAIPIYQGAQFSPDLSKRDEVAIRNQFGPNAEVYTLATDDSFPQVFHYYTTYLGQFRAFETHDTYPPKHQNWRNLEVQLNQAMQDPFIPGQTIGLTDKQVTLQIAETEAEPKTVIRYVVTPYAPPAPAPVAAVAAPAEAQPLAR